MKSDWTVACGVDDPTVALPWHNADRSLRFLDLRAMPEAIDQIPEAPAIRALQQRCAAGIDWTARCSPSNATCGAIPPISSMRRTFPSNVRSQAQLHRPASIDGLFRNFEALRICRAQAPNWRKAFQLQLRAVSRCFAVRTFFPRRLSPRRSLEQRIPDRLRLRCISGEYARIACRGRQRPPLYWPSSASDCYLGNGLQTLRHFGYFNRSKLQWKKRGRVAQSDRAPAF